MRTYMDAFDAHVRVLYTLSDLLRRAHVYIHAWLDKQYLHMCMRVCMHMCMYLHVCVCMYIKLYLPVAWEFDRANACFVARGRTVKLPVSPKLPVATN